MEKKKKICVAIGMTLLIGIFVYALLEIQKKNEEQAIEDIRKHYASMVVTTKETTLWKKEQEKYQEIGTVAPHVVLYLKALDEKEEYFQIEDTPYAIYFSDVEMTTEKNYAPSYSPYPEQITTTNPYHLKQDGKIKFTFYEEHQYPMIMKTDQSYQVYFQDELYTIEKEEVKQVDTMIGERINTKTILVLYIQDLEKLPDVLAKIRALGKRTITVTEYQMWTEDQVNLPETSILLLFDSITEEINQMLSANQQIGNIVWNRPNENNMPSTQEKWNTYTIQNTTSQEEIDMALSGVPWEVEDPATSIAVLNYHFFYDKQNGMSCNESICLDIAKFEEQLKYLKDNGYRTLTMQEFRDWMYGEIELPKKSVLLTIDDGALGTGTQNGNLLAPLLEKYESHATLFLITAWWDVENYRTAYLEVESHGDDLHVENYCSGKPRGAKALCLSKEDLQKDLKSSQQKLGTNLAFCYPFYLSNEEVRDTVEEAGFQLAFGGGNVKATRHSHKYLIPRYVIYQNITMQQFITMIS